MIYFFYGSDFKKSRERLNSLLGSLFKKKPEASFFKIDSGNLRESIIEELVLGQGLFEQRYIILLDGVLQNKESREIVLNKTKEMEKSLNIFVFIEGEIERSIFLKIEKKAKQVRLFGEAFKKTKNKKDFNIFTLTDSFAQKNKKNTWIIFQKALMSGIIPEDILNIFIWQIKNLLLVKENKTAQEANLSPFVFKKTLSFSKNFDTLELKKLSSKMLSLYHLNRKKGSDLEFELEKFLLNN